MNSKTFRGKNRSASTAIISLHFNKADEDQIEISYTEDKKTSESSKVENVSDALQSTLLMSESKQDLEHAARFQDKDDFENKEESISSSDFNVKSYWARVSKRTGSSHTNERILEDIIKGKFTKTVEGIKDDDCIKIETCNDKSPKSTVTDKNTNDEISSDITSTNGIANDLSPAIEAAELGNEDIFDHYINDELKKAKCEILKPNKQFSSSFTLSDWKKSSLDESSFQFSESDSKSKFTETSNSNFENDVKNKNFPEFEESLFCTVWKRCVNFVNFARNNVKFHILVAVLACLCAPIPSWLSGFFVGTILSSCLVYWLYKPQKSMKNFQNLNFLMPQNIQVAEFEYDSGIFKGWMNELPYFMNYNADKYHVTCTRSLYVRLDGSYLRFSFPQKNISKRAMFNEPRHEMQFVYQQHYDIAGAVVELLPKGLSNKRLWSKKYPICLRIPNSKEAVLSSTARLDIEGSFSAKTPAKKDNINKKFAPRINENNEIVIYLFSRTDRDKSLWYYRFKKASKMKILRPHSSVLSSKYDESDSSLENKRTLSVDFASLQFNSAIHTEQLLSQGSDEIDSFVEISISKQQKFELYMSSLLAPLQMEHPLSLSLLKKEKKDASDKKGQKSSLNQSSLMWLNALIGRLFFDFLIEDTWAQVVTEKIQKKLNKIKLPFFLDELTVKDINLGSALPKIHHASDPSVDERGLWIDIDLSYNGSFHMTLETKLNLRRFKTDSEEFWNSLSDTSKQDENFETTKSPIYNSEEEDSAESSSDEDVSFPETNVASSEEGSLPSTSGSTSKKILKFVDRLAQSPYFQHAAKNKYIKKAMDDISNTPLILTVEVQWLTGTLALNIPPWPTDRLWYGFRTNPFLSITARPKLGQHVVTLTHVTEWIEKKLVSEFQKVLVMPNMDDLIIPIMHSHPDIPEA